MTPTLTASDVAILSGGRGSAEEQEGDGDCEMEEEAGEE